RSPTGGSSAALTKASFIQANDPEHPILGLFPESAAHIRNVIPLLRSVAPASADGGGPQISGHDFLIGNRGMVVGDHPQRPETQFVIADRAAIPSGVYDPFG